MKLRIRHVATAFLLCLCAAAIVAAGTYKGLEPGTSTRADVDRVLGAPVREIEADRLYEYDPRGTGRRISVRYRGSAQVVEFIELEPDEAYTRRDYAGWFGLGNPTVTRKDGVGKRVEYHLVQGVSLHFEGAAESSPVVFFRHFDRHVFLDPDGQEASSARTSGGAGGLPTDAGTPPARATGPCEGILGAWLWFNGAMVECFPDGRCVANNGFSGPWKCLDPAGRLTIAWARPGQRVPYVDTLQLSPDGWALEGVNQSGQGVGGHRPEYTGGGPRPGCDALLGTWRWSNGAIVRCTGAGTCTSSFGTAGPWRCINRSGRFEIRWGKPGRPSEFIDIVVVSPLGSYLTGKNQYGVGLGAARQ